MLSVFNSFTAIEAISCGIFTVLAMGVSFIMALYCAKEFHGDKKKTILTFVGITTVMALLLCCFFGLAATAIKGIFFLFALVYCSYSDIKTRECENFPYILIAVAAFIGTEVSYIPNMLLAALFAFTIQIFGSWATRSILNGADLKLSVACCFLLGFPKGIIGLMIGMLFAIIVNVIKLKDKKEGFPLLPYFAVGFMAAYFL